MKRYILILALLVPLLVSGQNWVPLHNGGYVLNFQGNAVSQPEPWEERMLASYLEINNLNTYTEAQQDSILSRLSEPYIVNTFGEDGLNKTVCDFFLFFENSNTSTPVTTRTNTKTGSTLRWNYGGGNVYSQNNLPAQVNNGVVTVTSEDGFSNWTTVDLATNAFTNIVPSFQFHTNILTLFLFTNSSLGGEVEVDLTANTIANFNITNTDMIVDIDVFDGTTNIVNFNINDCTGSTGNIKYLSGNTGMTTVYCRGTDVTGWLDSITSINDAQIFLQNTLLTGYAGIGDIPAAWNNNNIFVENNRWSTLSVDNLIKELDSNFVSASGELRISGMNQYRSSLSNTAYNSLQSKGLTFNTDSRNYLEDSLTIGYSNDDSKLFVDFVTYPSGSNESVHPSIRYFDPAWNGYNYWMGITPFTDKNIIYENPSIYATNSIDTLIATTTNPIDPSRFPTSYNNDADIIRIDDSLYCIWRVSNDTVYYKASSDGNVWSTRRYLFNETRCFSPSIIEKEDTLFVYYNSSEPTENTTVLKRRYSITGINGDFSTTETITEIPEDTGRHWWHLDAKYISGEIYLILADAPEGGAGNANRIYLAKSTDGLNFTRDYFPVLNNNKTFSTFEHATYSMYRPSFDTYGDHYILYFTVIDENDDWYLGNTEMWLIP